MKAPFLILLLIATAASALAQSSPWEVKAGTEVLNPSTAPDGKHMMYFTNDDEVKVNCLDVTSGKNIWSRPLKDFKLYQLGRFIGNDTILVGNENRYEFLNTKDGSVYATLPIVGDDWSDVKWEIKADDGDNLVQPYFRDSIGVFYFDDGMQIVDLTKPAIIHQTGDPVRKVRYKDWEDVMMINSLSGADSIYFLDFKKKQVVYKASKYLNDLNSSVYQPFAISNSELLLFNENNIQSIDLTTGKQDAVIDIDPDDPEFYTPVIFKKGLYLMVSDESIQKLYNTKDGKLLWQTEPEAVQGVAEQLVELPNDEALMMSYDGNGKMTTHKINASTGKIIWSRSLFTQDGSFETGHKQGSKVWATVAKVALIMLTTQSRSSGRWGYNPRTGFSDYSSFSDMSVQRHNDAAIRRANDMYNSWINKEKSSDGYASLLATNDDQAILSLAGKIYTPGGSQKEYDGEGIVTLNLKDGSVANMTKCAMLSKSESGKFNAFKDMNIQKLDSAKALLGVHDVYILRGDDVERHSFGEDNLKFINSGTNTITFSANHDDDYYDYWRIDASVNPARQVLIARSTSPNVTFFDSADVETSLNITEKQISAFAPITGELTNASFASPKWTLSEDDLDKLDLDLPSQVSDNNHLQGITVRGADVMLMGEDGLGYISGDGACRWNQRWNPNAQKTTLGVTKVGHGLIYSTNDVTCIFDDHCPATQIARHEISNRYTKIMLTKNDDALVVDMDEGIIRGYPLH